MCGRMVIGDPDTAVRAANNRTDCAAPVLVGLHPRAANTNQYSWLYQTPPHRSADHSTVWRGAVIMG